MFTTDDLEQSLKAINIKGFLFEKEIMGFAWTNLKEAKVERIGLGYRGYPGSFHLYTPNVTIEFSEIESIINTVLEEHGVQQHCGNYTIQAQLSAIDRINLNNFDVEIVDHETFNIVALEVKKMINDGALPFFEKYNSLYNIADLLSEKRPEEIVPYMQGAILLPKTVLILKQVNHPTYKSKVVEFYQVLLQYAEKKESYRVFLKIFNDLFGEDLK